MLISVATANLYFIPFEETLDIIAEGGFQNIELDLFWKRKQIAMAQHLQDIPMTQAIQAIRQRGLTVTSIHDGGGVLPDEVPIDMAISGYINPRMDEALDQLGYAPGYLVFHPPQVGGNLDDNWWEQISDDIARALDPYRSVCKFLTLENMPLFDNLSVSLVTPEALRDFTRQYAFGVTIDTTHYAQIGENLLEAARVLRDSIRSIHLSDYLQGRTHVFPGEGELDLDGFLSLMDISKLEAITLECTLTTKDRPDRQMSYAEKVKRMKALKQTVEAMVQNKP